VQVGASILCEPFKKIERDYSICNNQPYPSLSMSTIVQLKSFSTKLYEFRVIMEIIPKKPDANDGDMQPGQVMVLKKCRPTVGNVKPRRPMVGKAEEIVTPQPTKPHVGVLSRSKEECQAMNDNELLAEFVRITGHSTLGCCHCGKKNGFPTQKPIEERWVNAIRSHTSKYGLYHGMTVPKTCDFQRVRNTLKNPISNPYYARLYKGPHMTEKEREQFEEQHRQQLLEIDVIKRTS
jgi:hypothetical protein